MNLDSPKYLALFIGSIALLAFCGCWNYNEGVPEGKSVGETPLQEKLQLPYLLAHVISQQLSEYKVCSEELGGTPHVKTLNCIESDLHLNLLRALYLMKQPEIPEKARFQLTEIHKQSILYFGRHPTTSWFAHHGVTSDFGRDEPVLPRHYPAKQIFEASYPSRCFKSAGK